MRSRLLDWLQLTTTSMIQNNILCLTACYINLNYYEMSQKHYTAFMYNYCCTLFIVQTIINTNR